MGVFVGDNTGKFRPKDSLTREEMAQILTRGFQLQIRGDHNFRMSIEMDGRILRLLQLNQIILRLELVMVNSHLKCM